MTGSRNQERSQLSVDVLFVKSWLLKDFGFVGHKVFVASTELYCGSTKAATDNT